MRKRTLHLVPVTELEADAQLVLREIRNHPEVRKFMYTDHVIGVNEHLRWINQLKTDTSRLVFAIVDGEPIGAVSLQALDVENKRSDCSFYLTPKERGRGVSIAVERQFIQFAFEAFGLEKLNAAVLEGNEASIRFHGRLGFEEEGFRKSEVLKDGKRLGVHVLGLQKAAWAKNAITLEPDQGAGSEQLAIEIHWAPGNKNATVIDRIEAARARNNVNWMNILRIAVERSPSNAKKIIGEIKEIDQEISALTAELNLEP